MLGSCDCNCDPKNMTNEEVKNLINKHAEILRKNGPQIASNGATANNNANNNAKNQPHLGGKRRKHKATHKKRKTK